MVPGRRLWLERAPSDRARKTAWTAVLVETPDGNGLASLVTTLPNRLVRSALESGLLSELDGWRLDRAEATIGASRFDFLLRRDGGSRLALEVKSVSLVENGIGRFPDAVTARGARHLRELSALSQRPGWAAAVLFVAQRDDVHAVEAAAELDPAFAEALDAARDAGVLACARRCRVRIEGVALGAPLAVL